MKRALVVALLLGVGGAVAAAEEESPTDPRLAEVQQTFDEGVRLAEAGQYAKAVTSLERSLALSEAAFGGGHPQVARCLDMLGAVHRHQGHSAQAVLLYERALALKEAALGPRHPIVATALDNLAGLHASQGHYAQAVLLYERVLAIEEAVLGPEHPDVAITVDNLAQLQKLQGNYARAEALHERSLALVEARLGPEHPDVATVLNNLADVHGRQGQYARAEALHERALAIRQAVLDPKHPDVAGSLHNLATLYIDQGQYARAEPLAVRALAIEEEAMGPEHLTVALSVHTLANIQAYQGRYARAEPLYARALRLKEKTLGKAHPSVAVTLNSLAGLYLAQGHYARAEPLHVRALAIQEAALGKGHPDVADSLHQLVHLFFLQGEYARAEPLAERALAIREAALRPEHPEVAASRHTLGSLYSAQGQYARAEPLYERALASLEASLGPEHPTVGSILGTLAHLHTQQLQYARAQPLAERALAIQEKALGPEHPKVASGLHQLASILANQRQFERAEALYARALAIQEATLGPEHPEVASVLHSFSLLLSTREEYARAEPLMERALAIKEAVLGKSHPDVATSLHVLANLSLAQGKAARAEALLERALELWASSPVRNHPDGAISLNLLAELRLAQQRLSQALPLFEQALTRSEQHLRQEVFAYSEARLASVLEQLRIEEERLYTLVRAHPDNRQVRHLALTAALLRKGRSVEELAGTSRIIYRGLGPEDRQAFERLRGLRTQLATLSLAGPAQGTPAEYRQRLKKLAKEADALEANLSRRSEPLRALQALPPASELVARVAAALPRQGVLVELVAYHDRPVVPRNGSAVWRSVGELRYLALLLFADGRTVAVDLGPAAPLEAAAQGLHRALVSRAVAFQPAAEALHALAFRPLLPHLRPGQRLFLSPDGQLAIVPFAALHDGSRFLVEDWDFTYLTSGKDLLRRPEDNPSASAVVVLADPDFSAPPAAPAVAAQPLLAERSESLLEFFSTLRAGGATPAWKPLPGTRQEAEAIQRLLPRAKLLLGGAATKEALLKLETPGVLHIATHGFFLEDASAEEGTRAVVKPGLVNSGQPRRSPDPLLRSGLVLAGAQAPQAGGPSRPEDSLVTALELAGMDLWGTQLVVLSACETGRGDVKLGQGVYGLRRALVVAGAETVVTSLWKVNDETTGALMEGYYRQLLAGQGRATALREAMKELRKKKPHPYYWAPFIAIGRNAPLRGLAQPEVARPAP